MYRLPWQGSEHWEAGTGLSRNQWTSTAQLSQGL